MFLEGKCIAFVPEAVTVGTGPSKARTPVIIPLCMQDAGRKTSEKDRCVEVLQDFETKSLFDTRFMMFNSLYTDDAVALKASSSILPSGDRSNVLYLKGGEYY